MAEYTADLSGDDEHIAARANIAEDHCKAHTAEYNLLLTRRVTIPGKGIYDWLTGSNELEQAQEQRDGWCRVAKEYRAELERRKQEDPSVAETEAEVASDLEAMREEHRQAARDIEASYWAEGGPFGGITATARAVTGAAQTVGESVGEVVREGPVGFFGNLRENFFETWGLGKDQTAEERAVGFVRLFILAVGIYVSYRALGVIAGKGLGFAERSAERTKELMLHPEVHPALVEGVAGLAGD